MAEGDEKLSGLFEGVTSKGVALGEDEGVTSPLGVLDGVATGIALGEAEGVTLDGELEGVATGEVVGGLTTGVAEGVVLGVLAEGVALGGCVVGVVLGVAVGGCATGACGVAMHVDPIVKTPLLQVYSKPR